MLAMSRKSSISCFTCTGTILFKHGARVSKGGEVTGLGFPDFDLHRFEFVSPGAEQSLTDAQQVPTSENFAIHLDS